MEGGGGGGGGGGGVYYLLDISNISSFSFLFQSICTSRFFKSLVQKVVLLRSARMTKGVKGFSNILWNQVVQRKHFLEGHIPVRESIHRV